jgi:hypothetical protein
VVDMLLNDPGGPLPFEAKDLAHPVSEPAKPAGKHRGGGQIEARSTIKRVKDAKGA